MRSGAPERPLVSAILAACDEAEFIEAAVKSVLSQRTDGFELEVLVVNNGSTDNTPDIVANLAATDSRLKLFDNPVRSTPAAFNTGIRNARGEYICILGAHARYPPEYISVCVSEMRRWGAVACSGKILTVPANSCRRRKCVLGPWLIRFVRREILFVHRKPGLPTPFLFR